MAFILKALSDCLPFIKSNDNVAAVTHFDLKEQLMTDDILDLLLTTPITDVKDLKKQIDNIVGVSGWKENLAVRLLRCIEVVILEAVPMGVAMKLAFDMSISAATKFSKQHPAWFMVIAIGIMAVMAPWLLKFLGFAELGIVESMQYNISRSEGWG